MGIPGWACRSFYTWGGVCPASEPPSPHPLPTLASGIWEGSLSEHTPSSGPRERWLWCWGWEGTAGELGQQKPGSGQDLDLVVRRGWCG